MINECIHEVRGKSRKDTDCANKPTKSRFTAGLEGKIFFIYFFSPLARPVKASVPFRVEGRGGFVYAYKKKSLEYRATSFYIHS